MILLGILFVLLWVAALAALAIADPKVGPVRDLIDSAESALPNDAIYETHFFLGRLLSLCPCTAEASAAQYEKATFHRPPKPSPE